MDKTGTLTEGRPEVVEIVPFGGRTEIDLLRVAAALEARSGHPIARAILAKAAELKITAEPAEAVQAIPGRGVIGRVDGRALWLGSRRYVDEIGRASCRERVCQYVVVAGGAGALTKKQNKVRLIKRTDIS